MKPMRRRIVIRDLIFTLLLLAGAFFLCLLLQALFQSQTLIPAIFILAVFLISLVTEGYGWGIVSSLFSVAAVSYAFTFPYFTFGTAAPESLFSAAVMLVIAAVTSTLTTQIKRQEKIRAESEMETMRANLLRAISHDLRTPLTTIYGSCCAISENYSQLSQQQILKLLGEIREDSEWLIQMVENLLSITRIDGGQVTLIKTPTVLEELIDAVLVRFNKRYPLQPVQVRIPDEFICIPMDATLIEQVLFNLLENAVLHARGMNELSLTVSIQGGQAVFQVADDGCGISKERLAHIFTGRLEPRGTPTDGQKRSMGIGLSVCETIIKAHGGEIHARNGKNGGACFTFSLKMEANEAHGK